MRRIFNYYIYENGIIEGYIKYVNIIRKNEKSIYKSQFYGIINAAVFSGKTVFLLNQCLHYRLRYI